MIERDEREGAEVNSGCFSEPPLPRFASVEAGGGWVNDSVPEEEFQETVNKSKAMLKAVALAETFAKT